MNFFRHLFISVLKITPIICVSIFIPEKTFASCSPYPFKEGIVVKEVEGGIKLTSTKQVKVLSDNEKDIMNALKEAELLSIIQIRRFFYEGPGENNYFQGVLKGVVKVGECYESKKYVRVTLGISPKTIKAQSEFMPQR